MKGIIQTFGVAAFAASLFFIFLHIIWHPLLSYSVYTIPVMSICVGIFAVLYELIQESKNIKLK